MKKYTMQDFISQKIGITFTDISQVRTVLAACEKAGITWADKKPATSWEHISLSNDYLTCNGPWGKSGVLQVGIVDMSGDKVQLVPFSSFTFAQPSPTYTPPLWAGIVTAETTSQEVNVMLDHLRKVRFDKQQAEKPEQPKQQAEQPKPAEKPVQYREVKRKAEKGDRIKIVGADHPASSGLYKEGDVLVVLSREGKMLLNAKHVNREDIACINDTEYVVLDPIPAAPAQPWKPKAGELVQITADKSGWFKPDTFVTVVDTCACGHPRVRSEGCIRCLHQTTYLPVREEDRPAKVGDTVKIVAAEKYGNQYTNGDVRRVRKHWKESEGSVYIEDCSYCVHRDEYRVLVPYDPAEAAHE